MIIPPPVLPTLPNGGVLLVISKFVSVGLNVCDNDLELVVEEVVDHVIGDVNYMKFIRF